MLFVSRDYSTLAEVEDFVKQGESWKCTHFEPPCVLGSWGDSCMHGPGAFSYLTPYSPMGWRTMGNLISRPSCLGQKSKQVRSNEDFLKECYQRQREWPVREPPKEERKKEDVDHVDQEDQVPPQALTPDKNRSSPAPTVTSTSTLDNAWRSTPSPAKTPYNGSLPRRTNVPEYRRSPLSQCGTTERRASLQRRDSGSPWSWKTLNSREVTEVTEVTETIVTEIVEVTEYPPGQKGGDPIVTRTVRVLTGAAQELAEVVIILNNKLTNKFIIKA